MRNQAVAIVNAQPNASTSFPKIDMQQIYAASFIARFSDAAAAGTLKVQGSNAPCPYANVADNFTPPTASWVDIPSATVTVAAGATSLVPMPLNICYRWLRLVWTSTGGAGTITVEMNTQGF